MIVLTRRKVGEKHSEAETFECFTFKQAKQAAFGFKHASIRCDSCEALTINGTFCHELGCPEAWRDIPAECDECGCNFPRDHKAQRVCAECQEDNRAYWR